jgi:hypothetical protein
LLRAGTKIRIGAAMLAALVVLPGLLWGAGRVAAAPVAQPAGLSMTVQAGFEGHYKLGEWFPVQVTVSNNGQPFDAEVQVDAVGDNDQTVATYARPVALPAPARKQVTLYTYATSFQHTVRVRILQGNTVLLEQRAPIDPLSNGFLLGVVSDTPDQLNYLSGTTLGSAGGSGTTTVAHLAIEDLPASTAALAGVDALVFANADSGKLSPEVRQAIAGWVLEGGTLVVAGGANGPAAASGLSELLPVSITGSGPVDSLDALAAYAGGAPPSAAGLIANQTQLRADVGATEIVAGANGPLLARRAIGAGETYALAVDPSAPALKGWDRNTDLWKQILAGHLVQQSPAAARRTQSYYNGSNPYIGSAYYLGQLSPFDIPGIELPGVAVVGGFLFLYVLVIGPINWLVLRRMRRPDLAWVTIPALIIVFAGLAYIMSYQSKGSQLRLATSTVVHSYSGAPVAAVDSYIGIFSPGRQEYTLDFNDDAQITEVGSSVLGGPSNSGGSSARIYQGKPSSIRNLNIDTWTLRGFEAEMTVPYQPVYTAQLQLRQGTITGQITNQGATPLTDVAVVAGNTVQLLGPLGPGKQATVKLSGYTRGTVDLDQVLSRLVPGVQLQYYGGSNSAEDRRLRTRAALLFSALAVKQPAGDAPSVVVVGWGTQRPFDLTLSGGTPVHDDTVLVTSQLPVTQEPGTVFLGPSQIARTVLTGTVHTENGPNGTMLRLADAAVFEYQVPSTVPINRLILDYEVADYGPMNGAPALAVWNWQTSNWDEIREANTPSTSPSKQFGYSYSGDLPDAAAHMSEAGQVRLRVEPDTSSMNMLYLNRLDLSAEGRRP